MFSKVLRMSNSLFDFCFIQTLFDVPGSGTIRYLYQDGKLCAESRVIDYRYDGTLVAFYPDRSLWFILEHKYGQPASEMLVFYSKSEIENLGQKYLHPPIKRRIGFCNQVA